MLCLILKGMLTFEPIGCNSCFDLSDEKKSLLMQTVDEASSQQPAGQASGRCKFFYAA